MTSKNKPRLAYVDGLRGIAALGVMLYHLAVLPTPKLQVPAVLSKYILTGGTGITLFFVISAFTMCLTMEGRVTLKTDIYKFYIRRFFRIAPLFYIILAVSIFRDWYAFGARHDFKTLFLNVVFLFNLFPGESGGIAWASWTIGVEMLFYLLFPLFFRHVNSLAKAVGFFFALLIVSEIFHAAFAVIPLPKGHEAAFIKMNLLHQLPTFAMGMVTFYVLKQMNKTRVAGAWYWAVLLAGCYLYHSLLTGRMNLFLTPLSWQAVSFSMIVIGASAIQSSILVRCGAVFLGKISYSFYLIHPLIIFLLYPLYPKIYNLGLGTFIHFSISALVTVIPLILVSWMSYKFIEKPFIRLVSRRQGSKAVIAA